MNELIVFVGATEQILLPLAKFFQSNYFTMIISSMDETMTETIVQKLDNVGQTKAHFITIGLGSYFISKFLETHSQCVASLVVINTWITSFETPVEEQIDEQYLKNCQLYFSDISSSLSRVSCPVLFIASPEETATWNQMNNCLSLLPCTKIISIEGGHFSCLKQSFEKCSSQIEAFLQTSSYDPTTSKSKLDFSAVTLPSSTVAERLLRILKLRGVDYIFSNSGTDFTPIIDAMANVEQQSEIPEFIYAPHENTTIGMAHGYELLSRKVQGVMAHVHVGTANIGLGIMNANRSRTPVLVMAGRSPYYEEGKAGIRSNFVQWGQESFDQGASFREFTKWDYELRSGHAMEKVIERALAIATSDPKGPVYLTLPKEPLCETVPEAKLTHVSRMNTACATQPDQNSLQNALQWIQKSKRILIVTADLGRFVSGAESLARFSEVFGAGVVEFGKRNFFNFPTEHPHHLGFDPMPHIKSSDLIISIECPVPYIPAFLPKDIVIPPIISIAVDGLFSELPLRGFPCDLTLTGNPVATLRALVQLANNSKPSINTSLQAVHQQLFEEFRSAAKQLENKSVISKLYLSYCIGQVIDDDCIIFNEYNLEPMVVPRRTSSSWYENSCASGLGWALGAALGGKLACPNKTMIVTMGDGSYLFNVPLSAHHVASAHCIPILIIVFNDSAWSTIKKSVKGSHPNGTSVKKNQFSLCDFSCESQYDKVCEAMGGIGIKVEKPSELIEKLNTALHLVRTGDKHVLLNVVCERDG